MGYRNHTGIVTKKKPGLLTVMSIPRLWEYSCRCTDTDASRLWGECRRCTSPSRRM